METSFQKMNKRHWNGWGLPAGRTSYFSQQEADELALIISRVGVSCYPIRLGTRENWSCRPGRRPLDSVDESAETDRPVKLGEFEKRRRPALAQEIRRRAVEEPELVGVDILWRLVPRSLIAAMAGSVR